MKNRKIRMKLSVPSIERAIHEVEDYKSWLVQKSNLLLKRLGQMGLEVESAKFAHAEYDGTNDVRVILREEGSHICEIVAIGASVLFIEFGTGVVGPMHPETPPNLDRGSWSESEKGKGHWKDPDGWYYAHGKKSHGNGANMCVYDTVKELHLNFEALVREVFV